MIENLLDSLNAILLQHPHLLDVMRVLFWIKYWLLLGLFAVFVYLAYTDTPQPSKKPAKRPPEDVFIA